MKTLLIELLWLQLRSLGILRPGRHDLGSLREAAGLPPRFSSWLAESVRVLEVAGYLHLHDSAIVVTEEWEPPVPDEAFLDGTWARWEAEKARWLESPDLHAQMVLLDATMRALPAVLTGRLSATEVIFPGSSLTLVENVYKHNPMAEYFNAALARQVVEAVENRLAGEPATRLRIMEIGAGTGATSAVVLDSLRPLSHAIEEYRYTDLSPAFLNHAEQHYGPGSPFLTYALFDVETASSTPDEARFDIVIAANVLHATRNMATTVRHTRRLLKPGGLLLLNELTVNNLFNHLTFGLLDGWWRYDDGAIRIPGSPGLAPETWERLLHAEGLRDIAFPCRAAHDLGQQIIVARNDEAPPVRRGAGSMAVMSPPAPRTGTGAAPGSLQHLLAERIAASLRIPPSRIEPEEPFSSYGLDSILAINLVRSINEDLAVDLEITALFEHNTLAALAAAVQALRPAAFEPAPAPESTSSEAGDVGRAMTVVRNVLAAALRISPGRIEPDEPFASYGLDSIIAVNVTRQLNQLLGDDLDITVMFEHGTAGALAALIASREASGALVETPEAAAKVRPRIAVPPGNASPQAISRDVSDGAAELRPRPPEQGPLAPRQAVDRGRHGMPHGAAGAPSARPAPSTRPAPSAPATDPELDGFAIVGAHARFGPAEHLDDLWRIIEEGRSCITRRPASGGELTAEGGHWGSFVARVQDFEPLLFGLAPAEASRMSLEQKQMLTSTWNAIEDAGYTPKALSRRPTGVFIATGPSEDREAVAMKADAACDLLALPSPTIVPNRISYLLNLQGPSEACDTTCSSSLVALHRAIQAMREGECEQAIVGGVNLIQSDRGYRGMKAAGMLSEDGQISPFQDCATGTVRSEGVAAVLLKPLARALADGDHVYAVVKGTAVVHGGRGVSLTAPNIRGMAAAMTRAYRQAGIDPGTVSYIEAHGMASRLADGAEIGAFKTALSDLAASGAQPPRPDACHHVGTLKPSLGHSEVASGMAGLLKVVAALRHRVIPGIANFTAPSSSIALEGTSLRFTPHNLPWQALRDRNGSPLPRRASVNSYGISGVNAHAVLEEAPEEAPSEDDGPQRLHLILLSAGNRDALTARCADLLRFLEATPAVRMRDLAYTLQTGRVPMAARIAILAGTRDELVERLGMVLCSGIGTAAGDGVFVGDTDRRGSDALGFFTGRVGELLANALVSENMNEDLARYWVLGAGIDWEPHWHGRPRRRLSLPGYPFAAACGTPRPVPCTTDGPPPPPVAREHDAADLLELVSSILGLPAGEIDVDLPLADYGLNSLLVVTMLSRLRESDADLDPACLTAQTSLSDLLSRMRDGRKRAAGTTGGEPHGGFPELVRLNAAADGRPVFWIHAALGSVESFRAVAQRCPRPFYALQARGFMTEHSPIEGIEAMAEHYLAAIRSVQPQGPYDLGGFCLGGIIAYQMARRLQEDGQAVGSLVMIDSPDKTGLRQCGTADEISSMNAAFQIGNALLWPAEAVDHAEIVARLIHRDELGDVADDGDVIEKIADLVAGRGIAMTRPAISAFLRKNVDVQKAYRLADYHIQPLTEPEEISTIYIRNRSGMFYGALAPYFILPGTNFSLDNVNYWQDWQREMPTMEIVDVDADNHMTIMHDAPSISAILQICDQIYSDGAR